MQTRTLCLSILLACLFVFSVGVFSAYSQPKPSCAACGAAIWKGQPHRSGCKYAQQKSRPKTSAGVGYGSSNDFAMQMFGQMVGSLFNGILQQDNSSQQQQLLKQQMEHQKQEKLKEQAREKLKALQKAEGLRQTQAEAAKKEQGEKTLAKMMHIDGTRRKAQSTDSPLTPFSWDTPQLEAKPIGSGRYDTSGYTTWQRMICATYFSSKALEATRSGDVEEAAFMNAQSDKVTAGEMTAVECQMSGLQQLADLQRQNFTENTKLTKMVQLVPIIQEKIKQLQQTEWKLHEVQKEKKEAATKVEDARIKVEEAKVQIESAQSREEVAQADNLLQQALALQDEGTAELEHAKQAEEEYAQRKEKDLDDLQMLRQEMRIDTEGQQTGAQSF